jgi:hypothetical protein
MVQSKCTRRCCGYSCSWVKVSVPDCAVGIHVYGLKQVYQTALLLFMFMVRSKCTSLCRCYSVLWLKVSVPVLGVVIHVYGSK